jgi:transposase
MERLFAYMLTRLHGDRLGEWIATAQQAGLPSLTSFANGLLKRQRYGRAGFDLLRKRVLLEP